MVAKTQEPFFQGSTGKNSRGVLRIVILCLIAGAAIASRLFSVIRFESIIHEFDPWFNFRATKYLVSHGFYDFWDWFDDRTWHPLGRVTGGTLYPGLMVTSGVIYHALRALTIPVDIRNICVLLAPGFSGLTAFATYLFTNEMSTSPSAGLLAAIFMGIAPGYISRSVAGSYDNEAIAIFLLVFTFYLWIKAIKLGSAFWGALCALFYGYMVSAWGGYVFITNLIPLHVFVLVCMGRFSPRVYVSYCTWYALGTLASMQIPFVGFLPIRSSEHMSALGVFGLLQLVGFVEFVRSGVPSKQFATLLRGFVLAVFAISFGGLVLLTVSGVIAPWTGRFYSLEAYQWLRQNTKEDAKIMSWWDYGYQIGGMADRPTLVDNNTWNNTHIATVGKAMSSREEVSYPIMRQHEVDYVLVVFGGLLGYSGDDINKFLWMVRIAEGIWPDEVKERDFFTERGEYRVDDGATQTMKDSLMYKMSYYNYNSLFPPGQAQDRVRGVKMPEVGPVLNTVEEAFTSENWIIRIYKVKDLDNVGRDHASAASFERGNKKKKTTKKRGPKVLRVE
ncbi:hypothetical protein SS1G_01854 [Sclerotinia sclerotiorum 1980 UF-70]|uniref:Dolichyl-diphosphooligosaccharide--protein glycosyltransferase subunit STT3 n=1 Tax=Sclerotinia sclerotiorum (strain ATCC 18683 / 1980 / Ss-1) TaxID=665079 RepID=A7E974_SCLS1|nr:hypothetical protein SS1G_01854 [Sclerotinia sclerotiorum 1980 UF-70]EDN96926.1 hypothetical protein SS1G_01854 [Sclerotinia sclerotiorum 1980 UF-70]